MSLIKYYITLVSYVPTNSWVNTNILTCSNEMILTVKIIALILLVYLH